MLTPGRGTIGRVAQTLMVVILVALLFVSVLYANRLATGSLTIPADVVYDCVLAAATVVCALRVLAERRERAAWALMTGALACWTAGELYWDCVFGSLNNPPIPSPSDAFWLAFYPLAAASLVLLTRSRLRAISPEARTVALTAALGVSSVSAAVIFDTALRGTHGSFAFVATELAYPLGDLVLLAMLVLIGVASGPRLFRENWLPLVAAFAVFTVADTLYMVQSVAGTYHQYGLLDIGWPLALVLISFAAWMPFRRNLVQVREETSVVAPVVFSMLGLGVLISDHFRPTNGLALALAAGCIVSVGGGLVLAFRYRKAAYESSLARDQAIEAANAKSLFVATVSHELRTPLSGVIGMTGMLLETELTDRQREYADIVRSSSEGLLAIINDILDYSRNEAGKIHVQATDFAPREAIAEACATMLVGARAKGLDLRVISDPELPAFLHGDGRRIRQVVVNLVSNAVKFTSKGSVTVRVHATPVANATRMRVEVIDTGIGLDERSVERMFEPFTQGDSSPAREYGGTGLGLTISAQLIEAMGGTIGVNSKPGHGSTFWFELVLGPAATEQAAPSPDGVPRKPTTAPTLSDASPVVLVVEDNPVNQRVMVALLEKCGCRADTANDGREALTAVAQARYAAILMDCQMPVMDGFEATREIRRREYSDAHLPIIAVTAHSLAGAEEKCYAAGMDDYLPKPLRVEVLREALAKAIPVGAALTS
ncbi:MAG: ATP-binding protein [Solirubrobacteraceae bacterium]|jgi:signal transduction histidine kinase/CheY-like chemotaxis protein